MDNRRTLAVLSAATIAFFFMGGRFRELKELGSAEILMMPLKDNSYRAHTDSCPDAQRLWHSTLSLSLCFSPKLRSKDAYFSPLSGDYTDKGWQEEWRKSHYP